MSKNGGRENHPLQKRGLSGQAPDIPANPSGTYAKSGWAGMGDWLGTGRIATTHRTFLPFEEAREFVHSLKLKNQGDWNRFYKGQLPEKGTLPANIPANPQRTYTKEEWKGMGDWLGTGTIAGLSESLCLRSVFCCCFGSVS